MRRALLVKRGRNSFLLFFAALCWVGIGMSFDIKSGLIAKDFGAFLETKLNTMFADKEVKLSRIEGGVFRKLTVDDFSVSRKFSNLAETPTPIISIDRVIIKYNLLNLILRQFDKLGGIYLISPSLFFTVNQSGELAMSTAPSFIKRPTYTIQPIRFYILNGSLCGLTKEPILTNLVGAVTFSNSTLTFNNLRGTFLNMPVLVNGRIENPLELPVVKLRLLIKDRYYTARLAFKHTGQKPDGSVWGALNLFDRFNMHFNGKINVGGGDFIEIKDFLVEDWFNVNGDIDLTNKSSKFIITPKMGFIKIISDISKEKGLSIYAKINHLKLFGYDVLSQIDINTNIHNLEDSPSILKGMLKTQNLILNYKPFKEIKASWLLKKDNLFINNLELGDEYRLSGKLLLNKPYDMDLNLIIHNAELNDWVVFSGYDQPHIISGVMNGRLKIRGPLKAPVTNGKLEVRDGNIKDIRFNAVNFNLIGKGPILAISDSRIFKEGGFLYIDGEIDLRKLGKRNIFEDVQIKTDQRVIVWEGWDISKDIDNSEIKLKKDINEDFRVNFKTYSNARNIDESQKKNEIGLDYKIRNDDSINMRMKDDSAFVGVEHKIRF